MMIKRIMITGAQFNEQFKGTRFVKLTNESCCHNGFKYEDGLNVDVQEFRPNTNCYPGGFYFCEYDKFYMWHVHRQYIEKICNTGYVKMDYIWDVVIPDDAKVAIGSDKFKCDRFILSNKRSIWDNKNLCKEIVKYRGVALAHVKKQTPEICFEAVKQNKHALQYVNLSYLDLVKEKIHVVI